MLTSCDDYHDKYSQVSPVNPLLDTQAMTMYWNKEPHARWRWKQRFNGEDDARRWCVNYLSVTKQYRQQHVYNTLLKQYLTCILTPSSFLLLNSEHSLIIILCFSFFWIELLQGRMFKFDITLPLSEVVKCLLFMK